MSTNNAMWHYNLMVHIGVTAFAAAVAIASFALLIPLDSVPAVSGVSLIMGIAYGISLLLWLIVIVYYTNFPDNQNLVWLNTNLMFFVVLPATIGATAMNVTSIQNTRNLIAGQITSS